ncbi:MAG: type II toxin-antitoxin system VapC family toxin [Deltaproteobacteria bacterium]|nr:type II toxin-antitoxin system VapC family toxin [Deltaproteobacteria bacterium]
MPKGKRRRAIEYYLRDVVLASIPVLPYDGQAARIHAIERVRLTEQGKTPAFVDGQIAAVALANKLIVITADTNDFESFEGLTVMNWLE